MEVPTNLAQLDPLDRFKEVERVIEEATRENVPAEVMSKGDFEAKDKADARVRTIRLRLYMLGYLAEDSKSPDPKSGGLEEAITKFQQDAKRVDDSFEVDGWVGNAQTWPALTQLVGFEDDDDGFEAARWMIKGRISPVLERAIHLRLSVLGCIPNDALRPPELSDDFSLDVIKGLDQFDKTANLLLPDDQQLNRKSDLTGTIDALFDQDGLVHMMKQGSSRFLVEGWKRRWNDEETIRVNNFAISLARIELWLAGYKIKIEGVWVKSAAKKLKADEDTTDALIEFWKDRDEHDSHRRKHIAKDQLKVDFFEELVRMEEEAGSLKGEAGEEIARRYAEAYDEAKRQKQEDTFLEKLGSTFSSLASRIWDGLKRAWRAIVSFFRKVAKTVAQAATSLARLIYRYGSEAFGVIKNVFRALKTVVEFLVTRRSKGSDPRHLDIHHDLDFDLNIYLDARGDPERIEKTRRDFGFQCRLFNLGIRIVCFLMDSIAMLLKFTLPAVGWIQFLFSCNKIVDKVREIRDLIREYEETFQRELGDLAQA